MKTVFAAPQLLKRIMNSPRSSFSGGWAAKVMEMQANEASRLNTRVRANEGCIAGGVAGWAEGLFFDGITNWIPRVNGQLS